MYMTPNLEALVDFVKENYELRRGITNCRRISGSQTYSQHSWSNAVDIFTANKGYQDKMASELKKEFGPHIRNILTWRYNAAHWNHIHVSMWPKGWLTPPCEGGDLRVKHKNGDIGTVFTSDIGDDDLSILSDSEQRELQKFLNELKAVNSNVSFVRYLIPWFRLWRGHKPEDFTSGTSTASAHRRLDKLHEI